MDKITVRQGETFQLPITIDDESAETVQLKVWGDSEIISETESFINGEATIDAGIIEDSAGTYSYSITVTYSDDAIDILPDVADCEDCSYPVFEICEGDGVQA